MTEYIVIIARAWMRESGGYGVDYTSDLRRFTRRPDAIAHGFTLGESDDFNIGTVHGSRLVAVGWMCDDFDPDDADLPDHARQLGLVSP
jgi:hypothetical protein